MLYIRTDMNDIIATGHVMRCLAIADAAKAMGEDVTFLLADENAVELISDRGYETIVLNTLWNQMEEELEVLQKVIEKKGIDKLLVDSYQVTETYLRELKKLVNIAYIDDLNEFVYPVDMLICYAGYWKKFYHADRYPRTKLLLGLEYTPLRNTFKNTQRKVIKDTVDNLLIVTGGTDRYNIIERLLEAIDRTSYKQIDVVCGKYYMNYGQLCGKYINEKNVIIHKAINNLEEYMKQADVAITAGGTTLYELCAIGTPSISISFTDNQLDNVAQFAEDQIIDYAGDVRKDNIFEKVNYYIATFTKEKRCRQSQKMQVLVDGVGAQRIVEEFLKL